MLKFFKTITQKKKLTETKEELRQEGKFLGNEDLLFQYKTKLMSTNSGVESFLKTDPDPTTLERAFEEIIFHRDTYKNFCNMPKLEEYASSSRSRLGSDQSRLGSGQSLFDITVPPPSDNTLFQTRTDLPSIDRVLSGDVPSNNYLLSDE